MDSNGTGVLDLDGIRGLLSEVGFKVPREEVVIECAVQCGLPRSTTEFYFEDVLMVSRAFSECEGFARAEIEDFRETFKQNDADNSGSIDAVELGGVLRWMG